MKAWIVYGGTPEFWRATLVLENGWVAFEHICSHTSFMRGDLLEHRVKRLAVFDAMGISVEIQGDPIPGSENAPDGLIAKHEDESNWREFADRYHAAEAEIDKGGV